MTSIQQKLSLTVALCVLMALPVTASHADDMMPSLTDSAATDAMSAKMKSSTQAPMDKANAMKASGDQAMDHANATTSQASTDTMTKTATDKMMPNMTMGK